MSVEQTNVSVKVDSGSSGILAVIFTFFFAFIGFFFSTWLLGKWGFFKSLLITVLLFAIVLLGGFLIPFVGWFIVGPIVYIVMLILAYKSCQNNSVEIKMPTVEKTTIEK